MTEYEGMDGGFSRRQFISLGVCAACAVPLAGCVGVRGTATSSIDPNLSVFLSDIHVSGKDVKGQPTYQNPLFAKVVEQVLAMNPRPKRALIFGDVALWNGLSADYEVSSPLIQRLRDAGIEVYLTTGNHDHREPLFRFHPRQKEITPVSGRFVSVVDVGTADFVLLDSLKENEKGAGSGNAVDGALDAAQTDWLMSFAASANRPFFCGAHHPAHELSVGKKPLLAALGAFPLFAGYIHGHDHRWYKKWAKVAWSSPHVVRSVCLPSTGWWGDIGFATFRTDADGARLSLVQNDFFFPKPLAEDQRRPSEWNLILRENAGDSCFFTYGA